MLKEQSIAKHPVGLLFQHCYVGNKFGLLETIYAPSKLTALTRKCRIAPGQMEFER